MPKSPSILVASNPPVVVTLVKTLDEKLATKFKDTAEYTSAKINNIEIVVNLIAMLSGIAAGVSVAGIPFIPMIFAIAAGIKGFLNTNLTAEDILLISNVVHQYVILTCYPLIQTWLQYRACKEELEAAKRDVVSPIHEGTMTTCREPISKDKNTVIFEFIHEQLESYLAQMMKIAVSKETKVKGGKTAIFEIHSICSGIFVTLLQYLHMFGDKMDQRVFDHHPIFKVSETTPVAVALKNAVAAETEANAATSTMYTKLSAGVKRRVQYATKYMFNENPTAMVMSSSLAASSTMFGMSMPWMAGGRTNHRLQTRKNKSRKLKKRGR